MRRILLALPFALLPLAVAQAQSHDHDHAHEHTHDHGEEHGSLGAHEHGVASLNVALDGQTLEIQLESPAMNIVGSEHAASSESDKASVAAARARLEKPLQLFALPAAAGCSVTEVELQSPLFGKAHAHDEDDHAEHAAHDHEHSDIDAAYRLTCSNPDALETLDLTTLLRQFPATEKVAVQLIGRSGQQGAELSKAQPTLTF